MYYTNTTLCFGDLLHSIAYNRVPPLILPHKRYKVSLKRLHNHSNFVYTHIPICKYVRIMSTSRMNYVLIDVDYIYPLI